MKDKNKSAERNILVSLCVKDEHGVTVKGCIFRGTGTVALAVSMNKMRDVMISE